MNTVDKIKSKLPSFIQDSTEIDEVLGAFGNSMDNFSTELEKLNRAVSFKQSGGKFLDIALVDKNLSRNPSETDSMATLRVLNAVSTYEQRGSENGITEELGHLLGVSPYIQSSIFVLGVDALGTRAIGSNRSFWIQLWNETSLTESGITDFFKEISISRNYYGLDFITVTDGMDGFASHVASDFLGGTKVGFIIEDGGLRPIQRLTTFESTNIDLGANVANFTWIVDWVDYAQKGKKYSLKVEARFSANGSTGWTQWEEFGRNQVAHDGQVLRYAQWRITFDSRADALSDEIYMSEAAEYLFRSFILKGLTSSQAIYHTDISGISLQSSIGD